jgi:predicted MFS family arabinose efflux permease
MNDRRLVLAMCIGQVGGLLPHVTVPAVMVAHLIPLWQLSNAEAGLMASSYSVGYLISVPILTTLTDRFDARRVLAVGSAVSGGASIAFGLFAAEFWTACLFWALAGMGFAGAYMPGLKAMTDRLSTPDASRSITLYTSSYSLGIGLSFLVSQLVADVWGWRAAFVVTGLGSLAMLVVALGLRPRPPAASGARLSDVVTVFGNRPALGYIFGYGIHCFELAGMRTWIVAFWTFVVAYNGGSALLDPVSVSVIVSLVAMPASILGNECALRFGRQRTIATIMTLSAMIALAIGLAAGSAPAALLVLVLLYAVTVPADSGSLTSGMVGAADARFRGATMALHSTVGFALSSLGAWGVGRALDAAGGADQPSGWLAGFGIMAAGALTGPVVLWWFQRRQAAEAA